MSLSAIQCRMDAKTIRRMNLTHLERQWRSLAALERQTNGEVTASYLSQVKNGYREMGDRVARRLEEGTNQPMGWMDHLHHELDQFGDASVRFRTAEPVKVTQVVSKELTSAASPDTLSIPLLEIGAGMGVGQVQPEYETIVGKLDLNQHWVRTRLPNVTSPANVRIITGYGDSMAGTYEDGDTLFVDVGVHDVNVDAVYVFALNQELYVKRLQRRPDGTITVISDNPKYPAYQVTAREQMRVIGRVVGGWNWRKL
jgi:SOS-response transcriptional repressor LexA